MPESEYDVEYFVRAAHDAGQKLRVVSLACSKQERAICNPRSDRTKGTRGVAQTCNIAQTRHVFFHQRFQFVSC